MIKKICKYCKKPFDTRPDRGIFCSRECRGLSERNRVSITCGICKKVFIDVPGQHRKFCSYHCVGIANRERTKGKTWNWKGDKVSYRTLHTWVQKWKGSPNICEHCGKSGLKGRAIHWANISKKYLRNLDDWIRLCMQCHKTFDKKS